FNLAGIAYKVVGGPRFYEREETRDALAYLRLVRNIEDDLSFARIINKPRRGFGDMALQTLNMGARRMGVSMAEAGRRLLEADEVKGKAKNSLRAFLEALDRWQIEVKDRPPGELAEMILEESGYTQFWKNHKSPQAPTKLENLKELVQAASEYDTLPAFLDHVALVSERSAEATDGQVWLMTLHAAKGLEFPVVFLPGWEDGIFPSQRSLDENGETGLEEERRLAYVGITRAEQSCRISFAANRQIYGRWQSALPSRFIDELPEAHVDIQSEPGLYGAKASDLPAYSRFDATKTADDTYYDNPGWRRAQARQGQKRSAGTPQLEAKASLIASSAPGLSSYKTGERVIHQKFGGGQVIAIEGNKLHIKFDQAGLKKVIDSFVERAADI
ncbi:MAG: 3'-5' exonuclease, partial [Parvularculaceae bacterium]